MPTTDKDLLLFIFQSSLTLIRVILAQVIEARGVRFQDTSALVPLYRTFSVVCSVPTVGSTHLDIPNQVTRAAGLCLNVSLCDAESCDAESCDAESCDAKSCDARTGSNS